MAECNASTTASVGSDEKALESSSELAALREEMAELRKWTEKELEREMLERQREAKYVQNAVNILAQRSDAEIKARFKLAEHVQELIGEAKRNVEAVCAECAKQQDSIKDLWGSVNMLSIMLRRDQHPLIRVQEWIMEAKRHTEKVRAECQKHENVTDGLCSTLKSVTQEFNLDTPPEDAHSKKDSAEWMDWLSTSAKPKLDGVLAEYETQLYATHELLNSITALRASFEKEPPEKVIKSQDMDKAFLNFMAIVVERDAGEGKGLVKVMSTLSEATKSGSFGSGEQAEEWLGGVRKSLTEACRECELQKQATSELFNSIVKAKQSLNEQLQERIRLHDSGRPKWSAPEESQAKKESVNWQVAIEDMMKGGKKAPDTQSAGDEVYQADNSVLKASTPGLGFRNTPDLADMDKDKVLVPWGSLVCGVSHDENWLKVGERYLPKYLKKVAVLRPWQEPPKNNNLGAIPTDGASSPRKASSVPALEPIPESPSREANEIKEDRQGVEFTPPRTLSADSMGTDTSDPSTQLESPSREQSLDEEFSPQTCSVLQRFANSSHDQKAGEKPNEDEMQELITSTVKTAFENLQDQLRHEAARALENLQKESSLTSLTLESNLKGEIERLREQIPLEISQCFAKNKAAMVEQAAELKKSEPLLLDEKARSEIESVARKVYSERKALEKLQPDRSVSPCISGLRTEEVQQSQQFWGLVKQLKTSGVADEPPRERRISRKEESVTPPSALEMLHRSSTDSSVPEAPQVFLNARRTVSPGPSVSVCPPRGRNAPLSTRNTFPGTSSSAVRASSSPNLNNGAQGQALSASAPPPRSPRGVSPRGVSPIPAVSSSARANANRLVAPMSSKAATSGSGPPASQPSHLSAIPTSKVPLAHQVTRRTGGSSLPACPARVTESPGTAHRSVRPGNVSPVVTPRTCQPSGQLREVNSPAATNRRIDSLNGSYKSVVSAVSTAMSSGRSDGSDALTVKSVVSV